MLFRDRYRVHSKLGDALYGPILQCEDTFHRDARVAVKLISLVKAKDRLRYLTRADNPLQEKQIIQKLSTTRGHANVLKYHQIYEENQQDVMAFVMEFCDAGDLQQVMTRLPNKRFGEQAAFELFQQISSGVHFLHQHGIAHRDLSLENVLLAPNGVAKVFDFGLSVVSTQRCNEQVGKRFYSAPEVVSGKEYDPMQADVWSLGVILFILVTGSPLFALAKEDDMTFAIVQRCGMQKILKLWRIEHLFSASTVELLNGMLRANPEERLTLDEVVKRCATNSEGTGALV